MTTTIRIQIAHALPHEETVATDHHEWLRQLGEALREHAARLLDADVMLSGIDDPVAPDDDIPTALVCLITPLLLRSPDSRSGLQRIIDRSRSRRDTPLFLLAVDQLSNEMLPPEMAGSPVIDFSASWPRAANGHAIERADFGKSFWLGVDDLAYAIRDAMSDDGSSSMPTVFLAEPSPGLAEDRNRLRRELQRHGYRVASVPPTTQQEKFATMTRRELERTAVAVSFLGSSHGIVTSGATASLADLQLREIERRLGDDPSFTHLIWTPSRMEGNEGTGQQLAAGTMSSLSGEVELVQTSLEDLKALVLDALERNRTRAAATRQPEAPAMEPRGRIYLIHDRRDAEAIVPMARHLEACGIDVLLTDSPGDHTMIREQHFRNLRLCDGAIIFYGAVNEQWVRMKQGDLKKAAGYGRDRDLSAAIFVGPEPNPGKQRFNAGDLMVIRHYEEFAPGAIEPFLERLTTRIG